VGTFNNIQNALNTRLANISGLPVIYYPNDQKEPLQSTPYLRPTLLPATSQLYTLNDGDYHQGIYQIDIYKQLKFGSAPVLLIADAIRDGFRRQSLTSNGTIVHIQNISISQARKEEGWWSCYVEVNYLCVA